MFAKLLSISLRTWVFAILILPFSSPSVAATITITNGTQFTDASGNIIHAHGGGMLKYNNYYYWYGEFRDNNNLFAGVSCYRSTDLQNWENRGEVLTPSSASELYSCNIERPKIMYNASTNRFVMWMHWENGENYGEARAAVAYCDTPDGNFIYQGSFRPYANSGVTDHGKPGYMSRDCNVFVDDDNSGYFISSSNENMDLHLYRLTWDYRNIDTLVTKLFVGSQREAPCLFKRNGTYYLLTSGCTGWTPNQAKYAYSSSLSSGWSSLINIGDSKTYNSQPAFVLPMQGSNAFLYLGDRWAGAWGGKVNESQYVWLPLVFNSNTSLSLPYSLTVTIDASAGTVQRNSGEIYKIVNRNSNKLIDVNSNSTADGASIIQWSDHGGINQQWEINDLGNGYKKIISRSSGKLIEVKGWSTENGAKIDQWSDNGGTNQHWKFVDAGNGYYRIINRNSGKALNVTDSSTSDGAELEQWTDNAWSSQQWKMVQIE